MTNCTFCRIIAGDLPGSVIYEDDAIVAFLDLYPVHPGHTLVVPRRHMADLLACSEAAAGALFAVSAKLAPAVVQAVDAAGFNVWTANGVAAGQEIFHLHLHILPRFARDSFGLRFPKNYPEEATRAELDAMAGKIKARL